MADRGTSAAAERSTSRFDLGRITQYARRVPPAGIVLTVALVCRLGVLLRDHGLRGSNGYDASVYFAASDAFIHGRMPYRDFVMLHPPGQMLALTPFASLTNVLSDESAFTVANLGFAVLGAINAVLVLRVGVRLGLDRRAAIVGALFYATWFGAIGSEYLTKLEPTGNLLLLLALLAALRAQRGDGTWPALVAGAALGFAVSVKIWWIVPAVLVVVWHAVALRQVRAAVQMLCGAVAGGVVVNLPFFLLAPHRMWASVIQDQLGRSRIGQSAVARIGDLTTLPRLLGHLGRPAIVLGGVVVAALFAYAVRRAWHTRVARPAAVLVLVQLVVVLAAPSWFPYYCDYVAVALALTVAGAAASTKHARVRTVMGWAPIAAVALVTLSILGMGTRVLHPYHGAERLARDVAGYRCVMSDSPMNQIELDALSRGLAAGCPNWIDVTGPTYGSDRSPIASVPRSRNPKWQRDFVRYLRSGDVVIVSRSSGLGPGARAAIRRDGVLARAGGHTVYRVRPAAPEPSRARQAGR